MRSFSHSNIKDCFVKPSYSAYDSSLEQHNTLAYSFSMQVSEDEKVFPKNRRYNGLRQENGLWIKWIPSPALAKWKSTPIDS
jgi:hypothetical protein